MNQQHIWESRDEHDPEKGTMGDHPQIAVCKLCGIRAEDSTSDTCWGLRIQQLPAHGEINELLQNVDELLIEVESAFGGKFPVRRSVLTETFNDMIRVKLDPRKK